jgi:hypothetical protein
VVYCDPFHGLAKFKVVSAKLHSSLGIPEHNSPSLPNIREQFLDQFATGECLEHLLLL